MNDLVVATVDAGLRVRCDTKITPVTARVCEGLAWPFVVEATKKVESQVEGARYRWIPDNPNEPYATGKYVRVR